MGCNNKILKSCKDDENLIQPWVMSPRARDDTEQPTSLESVNLTSKEIRVAANSFYDVIGYRNKVNNFF